MGNKINKIQKLDIHTRGIYNNYCYVFITDYNFLEPHIGEIIYIKNDIISEVHTIVEALEYLNFIQIKYDPIHIYTSNQEAIDFMHECINNKEHDKLVQKISLLLSDKNIKFFYVNYDQNHANSFLFHQ